MSSVSSSPERSAPASRPGAVVKRQVLRDGVYDAVLEMLLDGRVEPGASLSIDGLARELGVSPTPVREALVQLEHTGLVTRAALKGYRVAPPLTPERMGALMEARAVIEVAAVRRAVPVADHVLGELEVIHERHRDAAERMLASTDGGAVRPEWATLRRYYSVDWDFHLVLLRHCHNPYLLTTAESLAPHIHRLRQSFNDGAIDALQAVAEHASIFEAVHSGDPEAAAATMAAHLANVRARALSDG